MSDSIRFTSRDQALTHARVSVAAAAGLDTTDLTPDFTRGPIDQHGSHEGVHALHGYGVTVPWWPERVSADYAEPAGWATAYADGAWEVT